VAAKSNLGQFFVLGDCWFLVHVISPKIKKWAVPDGNVPPFDQIHDYFLDLTGFKNLSSLQVLFARNIAE